MIALTVTLTGQLLVDPSLAKGFRLFRSIEDVGETSPHASSRRIHFPKLSDAEKAAIALGFATVGDALYVTKAGDGLIGFAPGVDTGIPLGRAIDGWRSSLDRLFGDDTVGPPVTQKHKTLVIDSNAVNLLRDDIGALANAYRLQIYDSRYGRHPIELLKVGGARWPFVELRSGLLIPFEDSFLPDDVVAMFEERVNSADIRVTSLLTTHDGDALRRLLEEVGDRLIPLENATDGYIPQSLLGGKINVLIGHVVNDAFVWETSTGATRAVNFSDIQRQAAEAHKAVLLVGCESFAGSRQSGLLFAARDSEIARNLKIALAARTYVEFLASLGSSQNPFVIRSAWLNEEADRVGADAWRLDRGKALLDAGALILKLDAPFRKLGLGTQAFRNAIGNVEALGHLFAMLIVIGYAVGVIMIPFAVRQSWSAFSRSAFRVPSPYLRPLSAYGLKLGRISLFLSLLPLSIAYSAAIAWGEKGWRNRLRVWRDREALCDGFWLRVMHPSETARSAARRLSTDVPNFVFQFSFAIVGLSVMAAYVIAAVLTIYFTGLTDHWPEVNATQIAGLCGVVLFAGLAIWKGVKPVMAWIDHLLMRFVQSQAPSPLKVAVLAAPAVLVLLALLIGVE